MADQLDTKLIETTEVEIALVLMHALAESGRAAGEAHFVAGEGEHLSGYEARPISAPLPYDDRSFNLGATENRPAVEHS